jgi:16S rRNA (cytosine967-C5)-methyltransferase
LAKVTAARKTALQIMRAIRSGELADRAFVRLIDEVPARDRAWLHELLYGTLRLRGRLDYILGQFVKRGVTKLDAEVLDILRLGAYQLLVMDSVPAYAAVSQAVELTKQSRKRSASGLVNGVLQSLQREGVKLAQDVAEWTSHPRWLLDRWQDRFGWQQTLALTEANNQRPELFVRAIGMSAAEAVTELTRKNISAEQVDGAPDAIRIVQGSVGDVLDSIPAIVQDPAAGLVARYAALDGVIADLCAAPGGKAIALADAAPKAIVVASDISESRMQRLTENIQRLANRVRIVVTVGDARQPAVEPVDGVLIDAPCTGTGTFRRHPDGKWRITREDLDALVQLQREVLDAAASVVKPGGTLVYSTCSIEDEENAQQIHAFIQRHGGKFKLASPTAWHQPNQLNEDGMLVMLPHTHGFDGAFAARLERIA